MSAFNALATSAGPRKAHSYRGARRNFARTIHRAGIGARWMDAAAFARSPQSLPLREFVAVNPYASDSEILGRFRDLAAHKPSVRVSPPAEPVAKIEPFEPSAPVAVIVSEDGLAPSIEGRAPAELATAKPKRARVRKPVAETGETPEPKAPRKRVAKAADAEPDAPKSAKPKPSRARNTVEEVR